MKLPLELSDKSEWVLLGPMGPGLIQQLSNLPIIAVDGGVNFSSRFDVWIGDADSAEKVPQGEAVFKLPRQKNVSDFASALELLNDGSVLKLHLWGFSGGRIDHELFVLGESLSFLSQHAESQIIIYNAQERVGFHLLGAGHWKFEHEGPFSLGSIDRNCVKLIGRCAYPIPKKLKLLPLSSFGLSNIGHGEMDLENEGPVFIYYPEGK